MCRWPFVYFFLYPTSQYARHVSRTVQNALTSVDNLSFVHEGTTRPNWNAGSTPDYSVAVAKYVVWLRGGFLARSFTLYSERILPRARTHTHKITERPGLNRGKYTASHITDSKWDCVTQYTELTKAFFTVKISYGLTVHSSAYFYFVPIEKYGVPWADFYQTHSQ